LRQLKQIWDGVANIKQKYKNHVLEKQIMRKNRGAKMESNIMHTKAANKEAQHQKGSVFPTRGNQSTISRISKAAVQRHPGKATAKKENLKFCKNCGTYVTSKHLFNCWNMPM
jgi:hypothetical protein